MFDTEGCLAMEDSERTTSAVLDEEGRWYNVEFGDHEDFARTVYVRLTGIDVIKAIMLDCVEEMIKRGYLFIHNDIFSGTTIRGAQHMNKRQFDSLLSFFGEKRLFRGWTVEKLWQQSDKYEE